MKRILILLLIFALSVSAMVSCGGKTSDEELEENKNGDQTTETEDPKPELPGVDFLNDDLSDYVEIDEKYYKGFTVTVDPGRISDLDINNRIIQTLRKYKSKDAVEGDGVITVGDVAHIYYKGYYMKDGEPYFFQGGDNTASATPHELEIGSGGFIPGFEYNLIGKNPADYTEENPIVVETFFPENYQSAELAGKTAYFIVTVEKLVEYDAPALDDTFVSETLKLSAEDLSAYDGETLAEKYRSYVRETILAENGLDVESLIMEAFWESVMEGAVVKKYPEKQVEEGYEALINELEYYYSYYSAYYKYDEFMCLYIGLDVGSDWKQFVRDLAKDQVKQQLIFYHIMNVEGFKPTGEKYDQLFDEYLVSALESNSITPDKYETEAEYLVAKESFKQQLLTKNGEDYFKAMFYYQETVKGIKSFANVVEIPK